MNNQDHDSIRIFSHPSQFGEWCISTDPDTFKISAKTYGFSYTLTNYSVPAFTKTAEKLHQLVVCVAQHRTGLSEWDLSDDRVSDSTKDWILELDKKFLMELVGEYLRMDSDGTLRSMVDYFEHKHSYCMSRMVVRELLLELVTTGQVKKLPSDEKAPAEFKSLIAIAMRWLDQEDS